MPASRLVQEGMVVPLKRARNSARMLVLDAVVVSDVGTVFSFMVCFLPRSRVCSVGNISVPQVQETMTPLAAALSAVMAYADAWGPDGFPVPLEEQDGDSSKDPVVNQAMPPKPFLLHRAVWAQAELLATRCQLLLRAGQTVSAEIRRKADLVR